MSVKIFNTRDLAIPTEEMKKPWPENYVNWTQRAESSLFDELKTTLSEAKDERPLQEFYAGHPNLLALVFPVHNCWVFPKPRLGGGKWIPDFLLCDRNSLGYHWTLIELESPTVEATNKDESISAGCHHAVQQIRDYRRWLRDNALFEEKQGFTGLNADCDGWVVIGRRDGARSEIEKQRLADFRRERIEIASYDRLIFAAQDHLHSLHREVPSAAAAPATSASSE
jgi:antiviral defense system Shedu protein SduA